VVASKNLLKTCNHEIINVVSTPVVDSSPRLGEAAEEVSEVEKERNGGAGQVQDRVEIVTFLVLLRGVSSELFGNDGPDEVGSVHVVGLQPG